KALQKYDVKKEKVFFDYAKHYGKTEMHEFVRTSYCRHSVPSKYQYKMTSSYDISFGYDIPSVC
ncbi:MAG: hypothetical protein IJK23_00930, partial [Clostridia bacterium]|nr:hypothetical protein [Clostridia bacterium]